VATIQKQQEVAGKSRAALEKEREKILRDKQKAEEEKRRKEEVALLKPVQMQKIPPGVDPKTILCVFFKAGACEKGNKCKFSHNPDVERKVEKRNVYDDTREQDKSGALQVSTPLCRRLINSVQRILWRTGMKRNCGTWCSQSTGTHVLPQTFASFLISFNTRLSNDTCRLCASSSLTLLSRRSAPVYRLRTASPLTFQN
jgi:hypothetical protein